tara:strand:- start:244 stop:1209 length:966 start_codon:yes stop_codon:yes gene_type:complete
MKTKKVALVTGNLGFIGGNLTKRLLGSDEYDFVIGFDSVTYAANPSFLAGCKDNPRYFSVYGDIRNIDRLNGTFEEFGVTHVFHLAAESHVDNSISDASPFFDTNVMGTLNVAQSCLDYRARLVHVSTDEVYGSLGPHDPEFTEGSHYAPNSPYAASKASSDLVVRSFFKTHGLEAMITNCSNNFGPNQHSEKFIPVVVDSLLNYKKIPVYGTGENIRDWLYVTDHCDALIAVMRHGEPGHKYNIGGGTEKTNIEIINMICGILGVHPEKSIQFVEDRKGHDFRYAVDSTKVTAHTCWKPQISFWVGMDSTVRYYRDLWQK